MRSEIKRVGKVLLILMVCAGLSTFVFMSLMGEQFGALFSTERALYFGRITNDKTVFMFFYRHPIVPGYTPLKDGYQLGSNTLYIMAWSPLAEGKEVPIKMVSYRLEKEPVTETTDNVTRTYEQEVRRDVKSEDMVLPALEREFSMREVGLAPHEALYYIDIVYGNETVLSIKHQTFEPMMEMPVMTRGELASQIMSYSSGTFITCLGAFALAFVMIRRVKYVPEVPREILAISGMLGLFVVGIGFLVTIFYLTPPRVVWFYPLEGAIFFFIAIGILRQQPTYWEFEGIEPRKGLAPAKKRMLFPVVHGSPPFIPPETWGGFFKGEKKPIIFKRGSESWGFELEGEDTRRFYVEKINDEPSRSDVKVLKDRIEVDLAGPIHARTVESYWHGGKTVSKLGLTLEKRAIEIETLKLERLRGYSEIAAEIGSRYGKQFLQALLRLYERLNIPIRETDLAITRKKPSPASEEEAAASEEEKE